MSRITKSGNPDRRTGGNLTEESRHIGGVRGFKNAIKILSRHGKETMAIMRDGPRLYPALPRNALQPPKHYLRAM